MKASIVILEITYDPRELDPPELWDWQLGITLERNMARLVTGYATRDPNQLELPA